MSDGVSFVMFMFLALSFMGGMYCGGDLMESKMQKGAVKHQCAHYDQATAAFVWNDDATSDKGGVDE